MLPGMGDATLTTDLGRVLVTGGSGFVGANLVTELLERGHQVRSFDRAPSPLPAHPRLQVLQGDICDTDTVAAAVDGIDTVFHTAAIIDLMGGASVTDEYRQRSFAVNVGGTENLVHAAQAAGVKRFVYTASNSVVMGGKRISGGDETLPYTERFNDLYTETKVVAEKFVLSQNGGEWRIADVLHPAQRHLGPRRPDHVPQAVRERARRPRQGAGRQQERQAGQLIRAQPDSRLHPRRPAPGARRHGTRAGVLHQRRRADQHVRVLPAGRRGVRAALAEDPGARAAGAFAMMVWQWLHFRFGLPKPLIEPLAVERLYLDNYFSIAKAKRDLGYEPLFTTEQAMDECLPYYVDLFKQMKAAGKAPAVSVAAAAPPGG